MDLSSLVRKSDYEWWIPATGPMRVPGVLYGSEALIADMDGQVFKVPAGHVVHIPAGMVHSHVSSPEEDVIFIAAKDTRHGIVGPAVDGKHNGPRTLPGFGDNKDNEWPLGPDGLPLPQSPRVSKEKVRYVYKWDELDRVPDGRALLPLPTLEESGILRCRTVAFEGAVASFLKSAPICVHLRPISFKALSHALPL